nr:MAG TPA: Major capsid protein [Microviridae sp.]
MKQSVFNLNVLKAHPERNAFDLSHNDVFSCAPGMLLPISCTEVLPNEHYEINPQIFLRTMPLNSAAFVRMRQHVEFFFVPMRTLCRQFNQFVVGTKYPSSSLDTINAFSGSLPKLSLASLRNWYSTAFGTDGLGCKRTFGALRLFDLLGYGFSTVRPVDKENYPDEYGTGTDVQKSPYLNPFRFAAYQKVYQDFYRNPYWEPVDVSAFNFDDKFNTIITAASDSKRLNSLFQLRYRNWAQDFFTSVKPSFQGAPFVTQSVNFSSFNRSVVGSAYTFNAKTDDLTASGLSVTNNSVSKGATIGANITTNGPMAIPVHNIRAAFALDKLYRLQQQSGNGSYGEQIRNRFGFGGVHDDWKSTYIGGSSSPVSIGEVITTANTQSGTEADNTVLGQTGDVYGKASSVNDSHIVFDTKEHGIIIGIFSVTPDADYNSFGIDPHNFKLSFEQFYQPEFDRLGHQPVNTYFLSCLNPLNDTSSTDWKQRVYGYQNRYLEYKTGIDRVHGQFCTGGSLSAWTAPRNTGILFDTGESPFNVYSLKVSPCILNSICSVAFNGEDNTDPILVDSHIGIKAIRPMSVSDEPLL